MSAELAGKVALVTGGSSGIGRAVALELASAGADVAITYLTRAGDAEDVASRIRAMGRRAEAVRADASDESQIKRSVADVAAALGGIDILVNNAGSLIERKRIDEMPTALWQQVIALNLTSVFLYTRETIPYMKQAGWGRIVNVSSIAARNGGGIGTAAYAAAKAGVSTLTRGVAKEVAGSGITVNGVAPGVIATPFHDSTPPERMAQMLATIPLGRAGAPEDVAGVVRFLCSDAASYITGEIVEVNGGMLMD